MNFLDHKGVREYEKCMGSGIIKVSGCNLFKHVRNLRVNYAASTSAKDTIWKYKWVENHEPDVFGRTVETVVNAQEVGAIGTALVVAAGIQGADVHELSRRFVKVERTYVPDRENKKVYERNYKVFKKLHKSNAAHFRALNSNRSE